ncbi:F-box domain-containing protein [Caenorhabditis elegans]|uniref:F-box domain-containing protein n=1 Tax=Caenorhabditis elegans TaxID=6239 RepID=Q18669_CAEEL|nr:F-box domain-containing protein [Caenorhabditis elegans]CAA93768.2 F-box domain-containing protein [Caenorhabditis elegans]|eukprot:NP_496494.2 Uncharacterized protein CELE_C47D12.4 [Caenorhabditis elegans]
MSSSPVTSFHLLKLPTLVLSEVLDHLKTMDIFILRATSRKTKCAVKQSLGHANKRQSEDRRFFVLNIHARRDYFEIIFQTLTADINLYKGGDVNRVVEIISDFLENQEDVKRVCINLYINDIYKEVDTKRLVALIVRKKISINNLTFDGKKKSNKLFRGLFKSKAADLKVRTVHDIQLNDINLMVHCWHVALAGINLNSDHLNVLLKKWKENSSLEYFCAREMESPLEKTIILEGTNSRQRSEDNRFYRFKNCEFLTTCNNGKESHLTIYEHCFFLSVPFRNNILIADNL